MWPLRLRLRLRDEGADEEAVLRPRPRRQLRVGPTANRSSVQYQASQWVDGAQA